MANTDKKQHYSLDVFHVWDDIEEELFSQFGFASNHQSFQLFAMFPEEPENMALCQAYSVADVQGLQLLKLASTNHLIQDLTTKKDKKISLVNTKYSIFFLFSAVTKYDTYTVLFTFTAF